MTRPANSENSGATKRAGFIALVGRPNVGKSTLLNAFTGAHLSIVTPWAQTTRERVMGIYTSATEQMVFVDTPGLLEPRYLLQVSMLETALVALRESDLVLLLLDAGRPEEVPTGEALELLRERRDDVFVAINKVDLDGAADAIERLAAWSRTELGIEPHRISATAGIGVQELRDELARALPESDFYYPPDEIAVQPVRFFVAEFIREAVFETYSEEIPYATVVRVEEFREAQDPVYIRATIYVERPSQKAIVIGRRGDAIKRLGERARQRIEHFLERRVYLDLWVKEMPGWRRKAPALKFLGYPVPDAADDSRRR